jgi:hypothetical protein
MVTSNALRLIKNWRQEIDEVAKAWQVDLWQRRHQLWSGTVPTNPIELLDPGVALVAQGYRVRSIGTLGEHFVNGVRSEVAGEIDRGERLVNISQRFRFEVQRFTLAHEFAHSVLHPNTATMHRDLPLEKSGVRQDHEEIEADRFASTFLMPERLLRARFQQCFGVPRVVMTEEMSHALCGTSVDSLRWRCRSERGLALLVASTDFFNGHRFIPLASQFRVGHKAMAIRLEDLDLIAF